MTFQHHKNIFNNNTLFYWITTIAIVIVLFFQGYSLFMYSNYSSEVMYTVLDNKFSQAVEEYRTNKLKKVDNSYTIEVNPSENDVASDKYIDVRPDSLSFDQIMYKMTSVTISRFEFNIQEMDSLYNKILTANNLNVDYEIIAYKSGTDQIIEKTNKFETDNISSTTKEVDSNIDVKVFFDNPVRLVAQKMLFYILISGLVLVAVLASLIYQLRIIFKQKRIETVRQNFTDSMVHELRNPLQGALSLVELIGNDSFAENISRRNTILERVTNNLNNLKILIDTIAERSFSEHTQLEANWQQGDLVQQINIIIENAAICTAKPIYFNTSFDSATNLCFYDSIHLPNAIKNLVENAIKYANDSVEITIETVIVSDNLSIKVSDNGIGIDKHDIGNVFNKYYRGDSIKKIAGFGLGLSYVKWVTQLHKGDVKIHSIKGKGSQFTINIPVKTDSK